jgi:hypothetical protein
MITKAEFIERNVKQAADLARHFVGAPEGVMEQSLLELQATLQAKLAEPLGPKIGAAMAAGFCAAVAGHRREIEERESNGSKLMPSLRICK